MNTLNIWGRFVPTFLFVTLWGTGAIVSRWGLDHTSPFIFLSLRFFIALICVIIFRKLVVGDSKLSIKSKIRIYCTGALMIGGYSIFYFLSLDNGVTPGVLATILGIQPILTLMLTERKFSVMRIIGLLIALLGLVLVVYQGIEISGILPMGILFAMAALGAMTFGTIFQKKLKYSPSTILPLQYLISTIMCVLLIPMQPIEFTVNLVSIGSLLWLAIIISVFAQLLLYKLISAGNLVNVTSLFYFVPGMTALMDFLILGNALPLLSICGLLMIVVGVYFTFTSKIQKVD